MRADLAAALLHDPDVLFLDEPTIGLDVVAKERIRQFIGELNRERGTTVILTTHDLADVEKLCARVIMIDHGRLLFDGALDELQRRFGGERELVVDFAEEYADPTVRGSQADRVRGRRARYAFARDEVSASAADRPLSGPLPRRRPLGARAADRGHSAAHLRGATPNEQRSVATPCPVPIPYALVLVPDPGSA